MKRQIGKIETFLAVVLVTLMCPLVAIAAPPPQVTVGATPGVSTNGTMPAFNPSNNNYVYQYTVNDGDSITDSIPVQICYSTVNGTWSYFTVSFGSAGPLSGVSVPSDITISLGDSACSTHNVNIATGPLNLASASTPETHEKNINIQPTNNKDPNNLNLNTLPNIKIRVAINPVQNDTSCFTTDSSGNLLTNCSDQPVIESGSDDGRFSIVVNKKKNIEVATNPGQFYYNILWENKTGQDQTVDVGFVLNNLVPKGAQAIHAWVFPPSFSGLSTADFEEVNDGLPGGSDGLIEGIVVKAGWTLWANYHVEWADLGFTVPLDCAGTCPEANQVFSVVGTITGEEFTRECASGAKGYKKQ